MPNFQIPLAFVLSTATGIGVLLLGILTYLDNRKNTINKIFLSLIIAAVFWLLSVVIRFGTDDLNIILFATRLSYATAIIVSFWINYFCYHFPKKNLYNYPLFLSLAGTLLVAAIALFSPYIVQSEVLINGTQGNIFGPLYYLFAIYFPLNVGWGLYNLLTKRKILDLVGNTQVNFILIGIVLTTLVGFTTNFIVPVIAQTTITERYGPLSIIFFITLTTYAIIKHHLFDIKVVATEIFTGVLLLLLFVNVFSSNTSAQYILNISILIAAGFFSWLLIRSVLFEVRSREKISKLATALKIANKKLSQVDKVKTEFISIASHQLRTPLTIIKGYTSMALEGTFGRFTKDQHAMIDKLSVSANRLINLVEDLLNISRLEQGRIEYEYKVMDIVPLVEGVVEELKPKAEKKGLKLVFEQPSVAIPHVRADEQKIRQVFINLVDNSVKYTEQGSVNVTLKREEDRVRFVVTDTGIGISKEDLSTLFHKFTRGSHVSQMYTEGVGLGLYFARKVVENHGGKLWAESDGEGKGSIFTVELPMAS